MDGNTVGVGAVLKLLPQLAGSAVTRITPAMATTAPVGLGIAIAPTVQ